MVLSNRDLSKTMTRKLLVIIITLICITTSNGKKNQSNLKNTSTEVEVETSNEVEDDSSTELEVKEQPYTSVWTIMYDWWNWMIGGYAQNKNAVGEPRTFGAIRRFQMLLIPVAFKFGILFAMVTILVFLAMKTVLLLKFLLIMNAATLFAKLLLSKSEHHYPPPPPWTAYHGWGHVQAPYWAGESHSSNKDVHLHIHGSNLAHQPWQRSDYATNGNEITVDAANELNNLGPLPYVRLVQNPPTPIYVNGSG